MYAIRIGRLIFFLCYKFRCQSSNPNCEDTSSDGSSEKYEDIDEVDGIESQSYTLEAWRLANKGVGQAFRDAKHFRESLNKFSISTGYDYRFIHNEPLRITVECSKVPCGWRTHASRSARHEELIIKKANLTHTCVVTMNENTHSKASKRWITSVIKEKVRLVPSTKSSDLVNEIHSEYHVSCNTTEFGVVKSKLERRFMARIYIPTTRSAGTVQPS